MGAVVLSLIIPTYNGERFLAEALESVCAQGDIGDIECIVVDDHSTDSTLSIANAFAARLPLVVVPKNAERGWVASSNAALAAARGVYSCFLHQDDVWLPERLSMLRALMCQYPDIDCFLTAARFIDDTGAGLGRWAPAMAVLPEVMPASQLIERLLVQNALAIPAPVFRTELARRVGGLDESLWYTADWDFWLKLVAAGKTGYIARETVGFRIHAGSQTVVRSGDAALFRAQMETVLHRHLGACWLGDDYLRAARFSIDVNVALAALLHGRPRQLLSLVKPFSRLDWRMLRLYSRYSCIGQRVLPRLRALLGGMTGKT